jgi:hypothetical protein
MRIITSEYFLCKLSPLYLCPEVLCLSFFSGYRLVQIGSGTRDRAARKAAFQRAENLYRKVDSTYNEVLTTVLAIIA